MQRPEGRPEWWDLAARTGKVGHPSRLDTRVKKDLLDGIRSGNSVAMACQYAGIAYSTFKSWMVRGKKGWEKKREAFVKAAAEWPHLDDPELLQVADAEVPTDEYMSFVADVTHVRSSMAVRLGLLVQTHARDDFKAAKWLLERRFREHWGPLSQQIELTGRAGGPIRIVVDVSREDAIDITPEVASQGGMGDLGFDAEDAEED